MSTLPTNNRTLFYLFALCCLLSQACKKDDDIYSVGSKNSTSVDQIIKVTNVSENTIPADLLSKSIISLHITPDALAANRVVTLSTTLGKFANGEKTTSVSADAYGNTQFSISSGEPGIAVITASVKSVSITQQITFISAMPDDLILSADKYLLDPTGSANITVKLFRNPGSGTVSDPVKVNFSISGPSDNLVIAPFSYSANGTATAVLANPFGAKGTFLLTATVTKQDGVLLSRNITIVIN